MHEWQNKIKWDDNGLVPVIVQESGSGQVLMHAWMNRDALQQTHDTGNAVYWSRSKQRLWLKGESSGHYQRVESLRLDCDHDTLLLTVMQEGGIACHTGRHHCFYLELDTNDEWQTTEQVLKDPSEIYNG